MLDIKYTAYGIVVKGTLRAVFLDETSALNQVLIYYRDQGAEIITLEGVRK
jgi:hypothetical protein